MSERPNRILVKLKNGKVCAVYAERPAEALIFTVDEKDEIHIWSQNRIELLANWKEDTAGKSQDVWDFYRGWYVYGEI